MTVDPKVQELEAVFDRMGSVLVCYSGGIDSAFVLAVANKVLGEKAVGMTAVSPSLAPFEKEAAEAVARQIGAKHVLVDSHEIDDEAYQANNADRCFHCKSELYRVSEVKSREWGIPHVVNGTNADDLGDYRPGLEAAKNAGVRSPLVELGFTKDDVRKGALALGMSIWDKPASACLSSRIKFGVTITVEELLKVGRAERLLKDLGFRQCRVRVHDAELVRVEVEADEVQRLAQPQIRAQVVEGLTALGWRYVTLDLEGFRSGSMNPRADDPAT